MSKGGLEQVISHILVQHLNHCAKLVLKHASTVPHNPNILHRAILLCRYTFSHLPTNIASYLTAPHTPASFQSLIPCLVLTNSHQPSAKSPGSAFRCFIAVYHSAFLSLLGWNTSTAPGAETGSLIVCVVNLWQGNITVGQAWAGRLSLLEERNLSAPGSVFRLFYSQSHPGGCSKAVTVKVGQGKSHFWTCKLFCYSLGFSCMESGFIGNGGKGKAGANIHLEGAPGSTLSYFILIMLYTGEEVDD